MAKKYVEKIPHACGTKRGLQVFLEEDGNYTGYCYSCNTYVKDPYADHEEGYSPPKPSIKSKEETQKEINGVAKFPQEALPLEKLTEEVVKYFGVRLGFDQQTASEVRSHYYPYYKGESLDAFQVKILATDKHPKKFFSIGAFDTCDPFGWKQAVAAGGKKLFITEGQKDCMALWQVLRSIGKSDYNPSVISLHNGVKSVDKMARYVKDFDRWAEVVVCFDMDDAGRQATKNFCKLYPTAKVATLPLKDAHDMLMAGREQELFQAVMFRAKTQLSDKLKRSSEVWDQASKRPEMGLSWPYPQLTSLTRGIRRGEGAYFGGGKRYAPYKLIELLETPNA